MGSRDAARAADIAGELSGKAGEQMSGTDNASAAMIGELIVMAVPYASHTSNLESVTPHLDGKIFVDVTVPLVPPRVRTVQLPKGGSVAKSVQSKLGKNVRVVSAFQNVAAAHLNDLDHSINCDVLVCGNDKAARAVVVRLAEDADMKAWHAGGIENSAVAEALTSVLIFMNSSYKIDGAGIQIVGEPQKDFQS
ncbi:MAG: NADPH-dependent F420 reductase [Rhodospirillales bacterium]